MTGLHPPVLLWSFTYSFLELHLLFLLPGRGVQAQQVAFFPVNFCQTLVPISGFAALCSGHWGGKAVQALSLPIPKTQGETEDSRDRFHGQR